MSLPLVQFRAPAGTIVTSPMPAYVLLLACLCHLLGSGCRNFSVVLVVAQACLSETAVAAMIVVGFVISLLTLILLIPILQRERGGGLGALT